MATLKSKHNPHFLLLPVNNQRTAWRPIAFPVVMVVPNRRDGLGNAIDNSSISNVRVQIENVPRRAVVAGHDHVGLLYPDRELYTQTIGTLELSHKFIDPSGFIFYDENGDVVAFESAKEDDTFEYTTYSGIRDRIQYLPGANYYDLSDVFVEFDETLPADNYIVSYNAEFFIRQIVTEGDVEQLICIDLSKQATAVLRQTTNHPGNVMEELHRLTPEPYFESSDRAQDTTIGFYRPFTDVLQDVFDEQWFLESLNWANEIRPEHVPYLSYLLGLDLPYFPKSLDNLRRTMLQNVVELQQIKGSRRALIELFELFGFNILLSNLWWSTDGTKLIRPGQDLPVGYEDQEITIEQKCQIEPLISAYNTDGFGELTIPLLHRPQDATFTGDFINTLNIPNITVDSYIVVKDSEAHVQAESLSDAMNDDPSGYGELVDCSLPIVGGDGIEGYSQVIVSGTQGIGLSETLTGTSPPLSKNGVTYTRTSNMLNVTFNGKLLFTSPNSIDGGRKELLLYAFATYNRTDIIVPEVLDKLQSNRFDLQLLTRSGEQVSADILVFLINFLFKLKAFHSLLNVISYNLDLTEVYEVTDFCVGGDVSQRYDTDAGKLQVPPAIIPDLTVDECNRDPVSLGYKDEDIALRNIKLERLQEEHQAWKDLDTRAGANTGSTFIVPTTDNLDRSDCKFTPMGQDRKTTAVPGNSTNTEIGPSPNANSAGVGSHSNTDESPVDRVPLDAHAVDGPETSSTNDSSGFGSFENQSTNDVTSHCELDKVTDYCYRGRVRDEMLYQQALVENESIVCTPCAVSMGSGVYFLLPEVSKDECFGIGAEPQPTACNSFLGRLERAYDSPSPDLHFSNRVGYQDHLFALQQPTLNLSDVILHFPGCRFATLDNLEVDYSDATWRAKPWDEAYSQLCYSGECTKNPTWLNAALTENSNDDLVLEYDDLPFTVAGNGQIADIPDMDDHTLDAGSLFDTDDVTHAVYMQDWDGHPAITLYGVCGEDGTAAATAGGVPIGNGLIETSDPLFSSARDCSGTQTDFVDGYPCDTGLQPYEGEDLDREGVFTQLISEMEVPTGGTGLTNLLFYMGSGIRVSLGHRLDCNCELADCDGTDTTTDNQLACAVDQFVDQDGERDWNCDQLEIVTTLLFEENLGGFCNTMDGAIPTMFELV